MGDHTGDSGIQQRHGTGEYGIDCRNREGLGHDDRTGERKAPDLVEHVHAKDRPVQQAHGSGETFTIVQLAY